MGHLKAADIELRGMESIYQLFRNRFQEDQQVRFVSEVMARKIE
jgi:hypothetical protein